MNRSRIEWCDYTWNPVVGCLNDCKTPDGKSYCYAKAMCRRFAGPWGLDHDDPFKPMFHQERLSDIIGKTNPNPVRIFVGSMCDLFGDWVPAEWINDILRIIWEEYNTLASPDPDDIVMIPDTYIFLTKNPRRYAEFDFPPNCWLGVTAERTSGKYSRINDDFIYGGLGKNIKFISWEPILGPLDQRIYWGNSQGEDENYTDIFAHINWLIIGAMTGPQGRKYPPKREWIEDAVVQCKERGIPVFMKPSVAPYVDKLIQEWPIIS